MTERKFRIPLAKEDQRKLEKLLTDVPQRTVVQYDWKSEQGRDFIKAVRRLQMTGVPARWIADTLGIAQAALEGAIGYWERPSVNRGSRYSRRKPGQRGREPRPLRPTADE